MKLERWLSLFFTLLTIASGIIWLVGRYADFEPVTIILGGLAALVGAFDEFFKKSKGLAVVMGIIGGAFFILGLTRAVSSEKPAPELIPTESPTAEVCFNCTTTETPNTPESLVATDTTSPWTPTAHQTVTQPNVTPTLILSCREWGSFVMEDFNDPSSGWYTDKSDTAELAYDNDEFRISVYRGNTMRQTYPQGGPAKCYLNFRLRVSIRYEGNDVGYTSILFWRQDAENYYELRLYTKDTQHLELIQYYQGQRIVIKSGFGDSFIYVGESTNKLDIEVRDKSLSIKVNGNSVAPIDLPALSQGGIRFGGCTCGSDEGGKDYYFDDVIIEPLW